MENCSLMQGIFKSRCFGKFPETTGFGISFRDSAENIHPRSAQYERARKKRFQSPPPRQPHQRLFTPNGQSGLVVSQDPGESEIPDPTSSTVSGTVRVGKSPH
jgi:hypothetical protein